MNDVRMEPTWRAALASEFEQDYFVQLTDYVRSEYAQHRIYPPGKQIFRAFDLCPFDRVRVVIIGQDPYHGPGQANGLCFSVNAGVRHPPSLVNIFKEIASDLGRPSASGGNLELWAQQGVLLLNATLTVREAAAGSHQGRGWERFTDAAIERLASQRQGIVYLLWGAYAQRKGSMIDRGANLVLETVHPSPLSAHRGFLGCRHFSQTNAYLTAAGHPPIEW